MDIGGTALILGAVVCFLLALQWGGVSKPWSSRDVIGTLVGAAVLLIAFIVLESYLGEQAALNPRLLKMKTMSIMMAYNAIISGCFFIFLYYLPIYFQVVSGVDAAESGIRSIPLVAGASIFAMTAGFVITATGEFQLVSLFGSTLVAVGSGLIYTLAVGSSSGEWIGYQVLVGIGLGLCMQVSFIEDNMILHGCVANIFSTDRRHRRTGYCRPCGPEHRLSNGSVLSASWGRHMAVGGPVAFRE